MRFDDDPLASLRTLVRADLRPVFNRHQLGRLVSAPLPDGAAWRLRAELLRAMGWPLGTGVSLASTPTLAVDRAPFSRLRVGDDVFVNVGAFWELVDDVTIGDRVAIGHDVLLLTSTHHIGPSFRRAGELRRGPVTIGDGAWLGSRSVILPGVTIGHGAIVAAGTVVRRDVEPDVIVGGDHAGISRRLDDGG
jgi:acetyltransferase-like isoleucine patch superfamily enzyme